jgi:hypothetical protein
VDVFGQFYGHLVHLRPFGIFMVIWYIISRFGMLDQEKSGNPEDTYVFVDSFYMFKLTYLGA